MIAYLKGKVLKKADKGLILNTGGTGYFIYLSANLLAEVNENEEREFFIHTHVREDALDLYGLSSYEDLNFFKTLLGVSGIGPKVAMDILSVPLDKIQIAIENEDLEFLKKIRGVGPKSAKRIILELKGKIASGQPDRLSGSLDKKVSRDVIDALMKLGYQKYQIMRNLSELPENLKEPEEIITYFLKNS